MVVPSVMTGTVASCGLLVGGAGRVFLVRECGAFPGHNWAFSRPGGRSDHVKVLVLWPQRLAAAAPAAGCGAQGFSVDSLSLSLSFF